MRKFLTFLLDEDDGSATLWNLFWLLGFGALLGLAVDTTAAMNTKARLQNVADASSHAAAIDLFPVASNAVATALDYAQENIPGIEGVVEPGDVTLGYWDRATRTFQSGDLPKYNAVRVVANRNNSRANALATTFLRVVGMHNWTINAASTSIYFTDLSVTDRCRKDGLLAGGKVEQTSNNLITGDYCMHGESGLKVSSNNIVTCGVEISTPTPDNWLNQAVPTPSGISAGCDTNYGALGNDQMVAQATVYRSVESQAELEYDNVKGILDAWTSGREVNDIFNAIPPYITHYEYATLDKINNDAKEGSLLPGTLYVVSCGSEDKKIQLTGLIRNVGIYTDCEIGVSKDKGVSNIKPDKVTGSFDKKDLCDPDTSTCSDVPWDAEILPVSSCEEALEAGYESYQTYYDTASGETYRDGVSVDDAQQDCAIEPGANGLWDNVFIFTTANADGDRSHTSITFPNNMQIGRLDGCTEGGGARIYAGGSVETPSGTMVHGSQFVVLGNLKLAAKSSGVYGLTAQAGGDIKYSAQGTLGGCPADEGAHASDVVITVRPTALVQ